MQKKFESYRLERRDENVREVWLSHAGSGSASTDHRHT